TASVVATDNETPPLTSATPATKSFTVTPPVNHPPVPLLKADVTQGPAVLHVTFDASDSKDPDASRTGDTVVEYDFDYGDGSPVDTKTVPAAAHDYQQPGVYQATLHVVDNHGLGSASDFMLEIKALNTPPAP